MKKVIAILAMLMLMPGAAHATVTLNMELGQLLGNTGVPLQENSTLTLWADTTGNGFDFSLLSDSWMIGADDFMIARFSSNNFLGEPGTSTDGIQFELTNFLGLNANDPLLFVWFDKPFSQTVAGPGVGIHYGTYRADQILNGSEIAWFTPADGSTVNLNFKTNAIGGTVPNSFALAQFQTQVVPEPVSAVLAMLGGGALALRRRLNRTEPK